MNIYKVLNDITLYIDEHIEEKIDYNQLAKIMAVNSYTMQRIFSVITGIPLAEYIRKRRLSQSATDLMDGNAKVMDIAMKYQYENATSFSRAFTSFHGIKPSEVTKNKKLKQFPRIVFNENVEIKKDIEYSIVELPSLKLYGVSTRVNNSTIGAIAPKFFEKIQNTYYNRYGNIKYAMISYDNPERDNCISYYVLYDTKIPGFEYIEIPKSKWVQFQINSQEAKDIQEMSHRFYLEFEPSCKYNLRNLPELEYYHDGITEFLVPIY